MALLDIIFPFIYLFYFIFIFILLTKLSMYVIKSSKVLHETKERRFDKHEE